MIAKMAKLAADKAWPMERVSTAAAIDSAQIAAKKTSVTVSVAHSRPVVLRLAQRYASRHWHTC